MVRRLAVLVGCNYARTNNELRGSFNSVWVWYELLLSRFGFKEQDITVLIDDGGGQMPTRTNILGELNKMVAMAKAGDVFFFLFSGQGILKSDHPAIVASDGNVTDVELKEVVDRVPEGASFTILADCSNSGKLIYGEKQQIPPETPGRYSPDAGILLNSCPKDEMMNPNEIDVTVPGRNAWTTYGPFAYAVKAILYGHPEPITNKDLVTLAQDKIPRPGLYCSDDNAEAFFLRQSPTT